MLFSAAAAVGGGSPFYAVPTEGRRASLILTFFLFFPSRWIYAANFEQPFTKEHARVVNEN